MRFLFFTRLPAKLLTNCIGNCFSKEEFSILNFENPSVFNSVGDLFLFRFQYRKSIFRSKQAFLEAFKKIKDREGVEILSDLKKLQNYMKKEGDRVNQLRTVAYMMRNEFLDLFEDLFEKGNYSEESNAFNGRKKFLDSVSIQMSEIS